MYILLLLDELVCSVHYIRLVDGGVKFSSVLADFPLLELSILIEGVSNSPNMLVDSSILFAILLVFGVFCLI